MPGPILIGSFAVLKLFVGLCGTVSGLAVAGAAKRCLDGRKNSTYFLFCIYFCFAVLIVLVSVLFCTYYFTSATSDVSELFLYYLVVFVAAIAVGFGGEVLSYLVPKNR